MGQRLSMILAVVLGLLVLILLWLMVSEGIFDSEEALDERAATLEDGPLEQPPFDDGAPAEPSIDPPTAEDSSEFSGPSVGLAGMVRIAADDLDVIDKQGRTVLQAKLARTTVMLSAMKRGKFLVPKGLVKGAEVRLYRDPQGKISIANALRTAPPSVRGSLALPPEVESPTSDKWEMDVGPIAIRDALLTIGFTNKPVKVKIDRGIVRVQQGPDDEKPRIYFDRIEGALVEPSPLPRPIRIAHAKGFVRLAGTPLVELAARACVGNSELRIHALVPKKETAVRITGDSAGLGGALGRMGLKIAGKKKVDKLVYQKGPVKLEGGPGCKDPTTEDSPEADQGQASP